MMRANTKIALKSRGTAVLSGFKGVDLNTSPLRVASNRATYMRNFICDNGINHKRPGWREELRFLDEHGNALAIHGIFPFADLLLVHAGTRIYKAKIKDGKWITKWLNNNDAVGINENRAQCFYQGGRAFIVGCGNYLCFDGTVLTPVSEIAYVPTTSVSISAGENDAVIGLVEDVNLATSRRKNTLVGENFQVNDVKSTSFTWRLDGEPNLNKEMTVTIEGVSPRYVSSTSEDDLLEEHSFTATLSCTDATTGDIILKTVEDDTGVECVYGAYTEDNEYTHTSGGHVVSGDFRAYSIGARVGTIVGDKLTLWISTASLEGDANITVEFSSYGSEAVTLKTCRFGTTFGVDGRSDRLFLAGNPDYKSSDFWSEANDFTYFPDGNTMEVGSSDTAVSGYARVSDSVLAVFKEEHYGEPTVYYRTGKEYDNADEAEYAAYFPAAAGIAGEGMVNPCAQTLAGDVLMIGKSGLYSLVLSSNVASGERYMIERSRPIYPALKVSDLSTACATVFNGRYYLAVDGKCYVADHHYKASFEGSTDYNYEWWVWDNVPANCFAEYAGELLFGTADGRICAFKEGTYSDVALIELNEGDLLCDDCGGLIYNDAVQPCVGDRILIKGNVYALLPSVTMVKNGVCFVEGDGIFSFYDGQTVYADGGVLSVNTPYTVTEVDAAAKSFILKNEQYTVNPLGIGFRLLERLESPTLYVAEVDTNKHHFTVSWGCDAESELLFLTNYNGGTINLIGRYERVSPVVAEWVTPILDMGTSLYAKTLLGVTVAREPGYPPPPVLAYETRRTLEEMSVRGGTPQLSLDALDFNVISFDREFVTSFTKRMNVRNFNYIVFRLLSDAPRDCAVSSITLEYKNNQKNKGVR